MLAGLKIVIVNWNLRDDTLACIDSLLQAGATASQVIVVDNGSQDGSIAAFKERFGPDLTLIANSENLGFAPASNQGARCALERDAEWVLFLNNDTLVARDFLAELTTALHQSPSYALLGPLILYHAAPERIWYLGDRLIPGTLITTNPYHRKSLDPALPAVMPVDFLNGCALLVKRAVFETVGFFDPDLVMYGEEVDLCWRARLAGFRLGSATRARVWHKVSLSADRVKPRTRYLRIRNQIRFYRRYARGLQRPLMFAFSLLRGLRLALGDLLRRQAGLIPPLLRGWQDGWWGDLPSGEK